MTRFNVGQLVRVTRIRSLAYGRVAKVVMAAPQRVKVQFADLPKAASLSQSFAGSLAIFESSELSPVDDVPAAAFYLLVTVVERRGDRRYVHHCLAHGQSRQQQRQVVDDVAQAWLDGGQWDADEQVYRFGCQHFVLAEDWHEISLAEYVNFRSGLSDCTADDS
ncbi:hypothetical protein [Leptolyngbya sp. BC1307]|uniref:hypothetical protein n=1 Tax=Leptolyngbya sp. BC1307 TaxID=2029589 RepID=UPI001140996B|nr:hypothetical protein [Leptolyngbya sp. BC1307]